MDLSRLNPPQKEAVTTTEGPLLVLAGAGSGKTRVITHRIAYLLRKGVPAKAILAVTFTNKAASEMKERVVKLAGKAASSVKVCTFHAFGADLLRKEIHHLGWPRRFAIADTGDQLALIKRAMRERQVDDRAFDARRVLVAISRAKNAFLTPEPKPEGQGDDYDLITAEVFPLYQLGLKAQGAVDFDDLIVLPAQLLREHPEVRARCVERFRYLLVDEFQDTNAAQMALLKQLSGERKNVCVVGDDDQCIYGWRGAEVRNILELERSFPGAKEVRLEQNYRSAGNVLTAANAVIAENPNRKPKRMWTSAEAGEKLRVVAAPSEEDEARFVASEIERLLAEGHPADEIAVLYRTNGQAHPVEEALRLRKIAYEVVGGTELFDRREVKDVVAYFKALANPRDELSLRRIINVPARGIGDVTVAHLCAHAAAKDLSLDEVLHRAKEVEALTPGAAAKVAEFASLLDRYRAEFGNGRLAEPARRLLAEVGYVDTAKSFAASAASGERRARSVEGICTSLANFERREGPKCDLLTYLNRLSLDSRDEEEGPSGRRVALMSLHAAKGLEFQVVFLIGMEEDLLPHSGMQGEPPNPEEERRLCYVGITRAKSRLYLTRATMRVKRGKEVPRTPSRFLENLPAELCEQVDLDAPPKGPPTEKGKSFFSDLKAKLAGSAPGRP